MIFTTIFRRLLIALPTLIGLSIVVFLLTKAIPGDPAQILLGDRASKEALEQTRKELGLDRPLYEQYGSYMFQVIQGDLGRSLVSKRKIMDIITERFPATIELATFAMILAILIGIPLGFISAIYRGKSLDFTVMSFSVAGVSMPVFWLGLVLVWVFSIELGLFPVSGRLDIEFVDYEPITGMLLVDAVILSDFELFKSALHHLVLPSLTLSSIPMAFLARMTRSTALDVIRQDYIRTAKAKGLSAISVYYRHAFKNTLPQILNVAGLQFGVLLGGAMITETIFSWPGMGSWILDSVNSRDFPAIESGVLTVAVAFILVNLVVDLIHGVVDPRVRIS